MRLLLAMSLGVAPVAQVAMPAPIAPVEPQPPLVNAPVAPEAIYVGRRTALSVIDLNGLGQGTGDPAVSRFPFNPNVGRLDVIPRLAPGTSRRDGGGAGLFTLTRDDRGNDRLLGQAFGSIDDLHLGQPLDLVYNNAEINRVASSANQINPANFSQATGNTISVAPHPNPPRLLVPSPNPRRGIDAEEPTVTSSVWVPDRVVTSVPPAIPSPLNVLVPPLDARYSGIFVGPQPPSQAVPVPTAPYTSRQQIGHFLYVVDRARQVVRVLNSNRFTELATVQVTDPTSAAMSPNLRWLAVSSFTTNTVWFIDVDPQSASFHRVIAQQSVGRGPNGLAWQPEGEELLVCSSLDSSVAILDASNAFTVRKVLRTGIRQPVDVAISARQTNLGLLTSTYFALVLNGDGTLAAYESGPTPFGPDDSVALPLPFTSATVVKARVALRPEFWIAHRDPNGLGQIAAVSVTLSGTQRTWRVDARYGGLDATTPIRDLLSGNAVVDLAFDEAYNDGASPDVRSPQQNLSYARHSGKGHLKQGPNGVIPAHRSQVLFVAHGDTGRVDVLYLATGQRLTSIDVPGVTRLGQYWRQ